MPYKNGNRCFEILVVEDDPGARYLVEAALKGSGSSHVVTCVSDAEAATELLRRRGEYAKASRPDLILLDLHLPKKSGWELLEEIKTDATLKRIPVIVMTTSVDQSHVDSVYDRHANCYMRKPSDWNELCRQIRLIEEFWFGMVLWPTATETAADR